MKIVKHPSCTHSLGAPADMQDGSCEALPVHYVDEGYGPFAVSYWRPEQSDLAEILAGGGISLWVRAAGRQHPVVAISTYPCFGNFIESGATMEGLAERWYGPVREELAQAKARIAELESEIKGQAGVVEAWDDLLAVACINAGVPDSQYEAICAELTEILRHKGVEL